MVFIRCVQTLFTEGYQLLQASILFHVETGRSMLGGRHTLCNMIVAEPTNCRQSLVRGHDIDGPSGPP